MRFFVTGAFGFVGQHLVRELIKSGHELAAFDLREPADNFSGIKAYMGDIRDDIALERAVADFLPDAIIHLGAMTFVPDSWSRPSKFFDVNLSGTINLLETVRKHVPNCLALIVSSSEVYGTGSAGTPVDEGAALNPQNPYAISKAAADLLARAYASQHGLRVLVARPGNHIGPGQSCDFVASSFVHQAAAIARKTAPQVIETGNLDSERDFTDVRDVARAYRLLVEKGKPGLAYNICSGRMVSIRHLLDRICAIADIQPEIRIDPAKLRAAEARPVLDTARIAKDTGWHPLIPLDETLRDMLADSGAQTL